MRGAPDEPTRPEPHDGSAVDEDGYDLEATVRIAADDDFGREHLLRYGARPPMSLARLIELPSGKLTTRDSSVPTKVGRAVSQSAERRRKITHRAKTT